MAANYLLQIIAGESVERVVTWSNSDGSLVDVTGYHAEIIFTSPVDGSVILQFSDTAPAAGCEIDVGGANGEFTLKVPAAAIASAPQTLNYRFLVTNPDGATRCLVFGQMVSAGLS